MDTRPGHDSMATALLPVSMPVVTTTWRHGFAPATRGRATVRELEPSDAPALLVMLTSADVSRFIAPLPTTIEGLEQLILRTRRERLEGRSASFAVVPEGMDAAVGFFEVRQLEPGFGTAEWVFAIGSEFWGSGLFVDAASLVMNFAFACIGVHRLEARSAVSNARGNNALRKIGAHCEGLLRRSFLKNGEFEDQALWSILDTDWLSTRWVKSHLVDLN